MQDMSTILFKSNQSFADDEKKLAYIRTNTLTALDELDFLRKTRLFIFLYENHLLPTILTANSNEKGLSLDLAGANLANITLKSSSFRKFEFEKLSLSSVDLTNVSFIECQFRDGVNFHNSAMSGAKFTRSRFECYEKTSTHTFFDRSTLNGTDFRSTFLCDVSFNKGNMSNVNFTETVFEGRIEFKETILTKADFRSTQIRYPLLITFFNSNLRDSVVNEDLFRRQGDLGNMQMFNVILPNGTWLMNKDTLVLNGDAETNCSTALNDHEIPHWSGFNPQSALDPTLSSDLHLMNSTHGQCVFNFTINDKVVAMYQSIDISDYSVFTDSGETEYEFRADVGCESGFLLITTSYYDASITRLSIAGFQSQITKEFAWQKWIASKRIPILTRTIKLQIVREIKGSCLLDNIELYIRKENTKG
ncbi:unnamed protein product [Rotaria sordida]|uniref:Pentapeptide repeat-containing protein n=1 Tax=Rotaria sordida TaxID=392033 RepID=A0A814E7M5_9BILA|nr:unnamed protein product [Rotaria sordida]CAF3735051.1 unnamed protein product [Rotaria sordida]